MSELIVERSGDVLKLSLDRPQRANSLGPDLVEELIQAFEDLRGARLVVLTGEGKSFCSGFDLSDIDSLSDGRVLGTATRSQPRRTTATAGCRPGSALITLQGSA